MAKYAKFFSLGGGTGPNGLQLPLGTVLDATLRQVQDGTGTGSPLYLSTGSVRIGTTAASAMYWDNTNNRLGIGVTPSTALTAQLSVGNTDFVVGANAGYSTYYGSSNNGLIQAKTSGTTTQLWFRSNGNPINENDNYWSKIEQVQGSAMRILSSRYGGLVLGNEGYNNAITLYNYAANQMPKVGINNSTPTALLQVGGIGSTSATTSLLVHNSAGGTALQITDDRTTTITGTQTNLSTNKVYVGALSLTSAGTGDTGQGVYSTGVDGQMVLAGSLGGFVVKSWANSTITLQNTSNPKNLFSIQQYGFSDGNTDYLTGNTLNLAPIYNFIGIRTGTIVRGIYYNPTLTSLINTTHIAFENTTGDVLFGTTSGKATFGSGVAGTSYIEIKPGITNGNNRITFNDFDGGTSTRGGFIEISTYLAQINFGSYNPFYLGDSSKPYNFYKVAGLSNIIISTGNVIPTDSGALFQVKGTGSTSATTSLLVQNSAGNNTLQVLDDATVIINGNNTSSTQLFRVNNSSGNYAIRTFNDYSTAFGYFGAGDAVNILSGGVSSAFRAGLPLISPSWYAGYFSCATGDVRIGQDPTGTNSNPSAILQCNTTTQGFLPPRVTTVQKNAIATPAAGLMVYDTNLARPCFYNGTTWTTL